MRNSACCTHANTHEAKETHVCIPTCLFPPLPVTNPSVVPFLHSNRPCHSFFGDKDGCGGGEGGEREGCEDWSDAWECWASQEKLWRPGWQAAVITRDNPTVSHRWPTRVLLGASYQQGQVPIRWARLQHRWTALSVSGRSVGSWSLTLAKLG